MIATRRNRRIMLTLGGSLALTLASGCNAAEEFRSIAGGQIQSGLTSIATGLIDGIFAVIDPDPITDPV